MTALPLGPLFRRAGLAAGVMVFYRLAFLFVHANRGYHLARRSRPFQRELPDCRARVLVVGDSTGVGTGALCAEDSIAGLLAREYPDVAITNRARNGAKAADALRQLEHLPAVARFDVVLVHVGGNDILRATPLPQLESDITATLRAARTRAATVIFMGAPDIGQCPVFFPPFSWLLTMRSRCSRDMFLRIACEEGVTYIDLFRERGAALFAGNPRRYFADDRLHPTTESYRAAYDAICNGSQLHNVLRAVGIAAEIDPGMS
ncbi:MAG: SGNH/GDSL hydrolase family protein [Casimicrobiaceae bacterium]